MLYQLSYVRVPAFYLCSVAFSARFAGALVASISSGATGSPHGRGSCLVRANSVERCLGGG
jgi:hypothetical protein